MNQELEQQILSKSTEGSNIIDLDQVYINPERARKDTAEVRRYIDEELCPSIIDNGLIHPPILNFFDEPIERDGKTYPCELVAGWCRTQAFIMLGLTKLPYNPRRNLSETEYKEVELEENFRRRDMTWQEKVCAIDEIHQLKMRRAGADGTKWGQSHTGKMLGTSAGHVNNAKKLASYIRNGDEEIINASGVTDALNILVKRKDDELAQYVAAQAGVQTATPTPVTGMGPIRGSTGISLDDVAATSPQTNSPTESVDTGTVMELTQVTEFDLNKIVFNEDNRDWFARQPDESVDLVYTDIPFGIDMDNLDFNAADLDRVADAHDVEENVSQMKPFLENSYRVLKDGKYCLFWYDLKHHEKLIEWALEVGFTAQPYPIVWCKTHPCRNRAGNIWWTKAIEYVMVLRKGTATLREPQTKNYILADGSAERKMQRNPFSKPFEVSKQIIEPLTIPGDLMLDPYAGEGSIVRAGLNMGLQVIGVEKEEHHYIRLVEHVRNVLTAMTRGKAKFKEVEKFAAAADEQIKF